MFTRKLLNYFPSAYIVCLLLSYKVELTELDDIIKVDLRPTIKPHSVLPKATTL